MDQVYEVDVRNYLLNLMLVKKMKIVNKKRLYCCSDFRK